MGQAFGAWEDLRGYGKPDHPNILQLVNPGIMPFIKYPMESCDYMIK